VIRTLAVGGPRWEDAIEGADPAAWLILAARWSAVEPERGRYDDAALGRARRALIAARKRGVDVILVAHCGALPDWQIERGGWTDRDALSGFGCYVDAVAHSWGELARHWIGLWEPLAEATVYGDDQRRVARTLLDAQASAWLHLRKAAGPGGGGTLVGVAERFDHPQRKRDRLIGRASEAHALVSVLSSGRLAPPFGAIGELPNGTPATDFTLALHPNLVDMHQLWRSGRSVFVLGDRTVAAEAEAQGVHVAGAGAAPDAMR
jgi:hypothetical protein